ncbi:MAG: M28 family peptidase [Calditrichia bacterium]
MTMLFLVFFSLQCASQKSADDLRFDKLRDHVKFLSSDDLKGRKPGSPEIEIAAAYLAAEMKAAGADALGENYRQSFDVITGINLVGENNYVVTAGRSAPTNFVVGETYTPIGLSASGKASGKMVFAGYGISAPEKNYDDYANLDVSGAIVVVLRGFPLVDGDPHGPLANFAEIHYKLINAREKGAAAVILIDTHDMRDDLITLAPPEMSNVNGMPAIHAKREIIAPLFGGEEILLAAEKQILDTKAPASRSLKPWGASLSVGVELLKTQTVNVVGRVSGTNPDLADEAIIVGAHYDHLGMGGAGSRDDSGEPKIHNGADDNASGTAAVLEIARMVAKNPLPRPVIFMGFSAEEMGLLGSSHYVDNPLVDLDQSIAMINLDMIGRMEQGKIILNGTGTASEWPAMLDSLQNKYNFQMTRNKDGYGPSDYSSFYSKKLPVISLFTGLHDDYHRPGDDWDKINYAGMDSLTEFTHDIVSYIAMMAEKPTFIEAEESPRARSSMSFRVRMGTIPDYSDHPQGLRITGVKAGSPAENAGLAGGDIITAFGDLKIKNIYDYTFALGKFAPGDTVVIKVLREEKQIQFTAVLEAL